MRVAFLYNRSSEDPAHAAEDEVPARSPVVAALRQLGHKVTPIACTLDLATVQSRLLRAKPDVAFNRVESLGRSDAMMPAVTLLLEAMQIPYTGCSSVAITAAGNKVFAKERLVRAGLPTPRWIEQGAWSTKQGVMEEYFSSLPAPCSSLDNPKFIVKSIHEHASFQMDDESVVWMTGLEQMRELLREREAATGRAHFAEEFIEGREFNLSLIGEGPRVLPPAEIDFSAFPLGKQRIVGHGAKWDTASFEYHHTPRRLEFPAIDRPLVQRLSEIAAECWRLFDLTGYARVDFRCDEEGQPWILEVNINPCISPDAGFAAAAKQAGIDYAETIGQILEDAVRRDQAAVRSKPHFQPAVLV